MIIDEEKFHELRKSLMLVSCELALVENDNINYHESFVNIEQAVMWLERGHEIEQAIEEHKKEHNL